MKKWVEADIVELNLKSTYQNGNGTNIDFYVEGAPSGTRGDDVPASGTVHDGVRDTNN